jgi:hypothetical protein
MYQRTVATSHLSADSSGVQRIIEEYHMRVECYGRNLFKDASNLSCCDVSPDAPSRPIRRYDERSRNDILSLKKTFICRVSYEDPVKPSLCPRFLVLLIGSGLCSVIDLGKGLHCSDRIALKWVLPSIYLA